MEFYMKMLTSVTLSALLVFAAAPVFAEKPDFSKTNAAKASYDFSQNKPATGNQLQRASSQHDFSKTLAATSQYDFSKNQPAIHSEPQPSTQHDFSKTAAF
ncbi:hypothetical protein EKG38_01070 [Shewanella canadensis]|uniref:Uncharacterized protein n=2 Tax=Shewanella canadensis TaxID=271096 RepID=A0A3S0LQJ9_9GAMM|nr:hypothetical protein EKG38_01070 [Shewanella canadensis]